MKRSKPLKPGKPPRRGKPLKPGGVPLKRTRIKQRSKTRAAFMATERGPLVRILIQAGVRCEIGPTLAEGAVRPLRCSGAVQGLHERRKRSSRGSLTMGANLIPACNWCNGWIEDNPAAARLLFGSELVVREGDPEWESLGARQDGASVAVKSCSTCGTAWVRNPPCGHEERP